MSLALIPPPVPWVTEQVEILKMSMAAIPVLPAPFHQGPDTP